MYLQEQEGADIWNNDESVCVEHARPVRAHKALARAGALAWVGTTNQNAVANVCTAVLRVHEDRGEDGCVNIQ